MKLSKTDPALILLCCASALIGLAWIYFIGFVRDDAYITFRYAENISKGLGFVYNPGEPIYGTSSPGFTLLLVLMPFKTVVDAWVLDLIALVASVALVWKILEHFDVDQRKRILAIILLLWSDKLLLHFMEGMETGLVVACMLGSLYWMIKGESVFAGLFAGAMLWLRIDSGLWLAAMALVGLFHWRRGVFMFLLAAFLTYLPWLIFAHYYFGSIIPLTAIAKNVAYGLNPVPIAERFLTLFRWLSPFAVYHPRLVYTLPAATLIIALYGVWTYRRSAFVKVVALFFVVQTATIIALDLVVEPRYMVTTLYAVLFLFGLGVGELVTRWKIHYLAIFVLIYLYAAFGNAQPRLVRLRDYQTYVYNFTLRGMGGWFREHAEGKVVFLEPLGYVGYYSDNRLLDEVGLITPEVIDMKRSGLNPYQMAEELKPDYIVLHCDNIPADFGYKTVQRFDPLGFVDGVTWGDPSLQRNACYEILR